MSKRHTIEYIKQKIEKIGYTLLSTVYVNNYSNLKIRCNVGHEYITTWSVIREGCMCPKCVVEERARKNRYTIEYIKEKTKELAEGYECLSDEYINAHVRLLFKCNKGHTYKAKWNKFQTGRRCWKCVKNRQKKKGHPNWKGGVTGLSISLYDTYASQISFCEEVQRDPGNNDWLQVRCTNSDCRKWFRPTYREMCGRIKALNRKNKGELRFYCSDECKKLCSIYGQYKYPKGFINTDNIRYDQAEWSQMVKERDECQCVKCGSTKKLVAHHIEGLIENPIMSADIDIGITLCKKCHKLAHKSIGCRFIDMKKENICYK
uniref:HNH endonuclease n=1 Tax=viral metagenome TaxID=1070528 RepID=A0A6M3KJI5_9ZZZZ